METVSSDKRQDKERKRVCRKKRKPEQVKQNRAAETIRRQQKRQKKYSEMDAFLKSKKEFPAYLCTCCNRTWFKGTVIQAKQKNFKNTNSEIIAEAFTGCKSFDGEEYICKSCSSVLKSNKLLPFATAHGFQLHVIPEELKNLC